MSLKEYKKKRDLKKSKEPEPIIKKSKRKNVRLSAEAKKKSRPSVLRGRSARKIKGFPRFVVHKHYASHLHWDLRLEIDNVLKSWAVPKQPPKAKGTKRLAIQVEDHPLNYAKFKGTIPEGNYGAGKVEIWDNGKYELIENASKTLKSVPRNIFKKMFTRGKIEFELHGKKLKGKYVLIKTNYAKNSWLFFKI